MPYERGLMPSAGGNENELPIIHIPTLIGTNVLAGTERAALPAAIAADAPPNPVMFDELSDAVSLTLHAFLVSTWYYLLID
jgi:hypothetical protein